MYIDLSCVVEMDSISVSERVTGEYPVNKIKGKLNKNDQLMDFLVQLS